MSARYIETGGVITPVIRRSFLSRFFNKVRASMAVPSTPPSTQTTKSVTTLDELSASGLSNFQLEKSAVKQLISYLDEQEHVMAAIQGHVPDIGDALLVATDARLIYLHDTPTFSHFEEFSYDNIERVTVSKTSRVLSTVALQTKLKTYQFDYVNPLVAERFRSRIQEYIGQQDNMRYNNHGMLGA